MQGERHRKRASADASADPSAEEGGMEIDLGDIWRRYRLPILLVALLTLVTFVLFLVVVVGLSIHAADYLARH